MAAGEKPYRIYKGGRLKGKVPLAPKPERDGPDVKPPSVERPKVRRSWSRRRRIGVGLLVLVVLFVLWGIASYFSFASGVAAANKRLDPQTRAVLKGGGGLLLSHPTNILLLGTDHANTDARAADQHSDSITIVRTDPGRHRIAFLSIPRDLRVPIPGHGDDKINTAFQIGGPALAAQTVAQFTGMPINHIVIVDFGSFEDLIDKLGGITVNVPENILSNRFDCPYSTAARCQRWPGWRFHKGPQHLNGHLALIYSRIRENRLNPGETDVTRADRQQSVLQAIASKLASPWTFLQLPFIGGDALKPLTTDLSTGEFLQLGWVKFRSSSGKTLHCRLGGDSGSYGGQDVIVPTEENGAVIQMVEGNSAPQPPPPGSGPFGPGCVVGSQTFR